MELQKFFLYSFVLGSLAILAACSSADSTAPTTTPTTPTAVTISGSIFASDVGGASVTVKDSSGNVVAGPVTTASDGSYSVDLLNTDLTSDLVFESTGGGFVDEETQANATAGSMAAYIEGGTLADGDSVHVTPGTTIHAALITDHGKTPIEAQTAFFNAFAYNPDFTMDPVDITDPSSTTADDAARLAGWRAAVLSRLANTIGLTPEQQFDMFAAIARDLSDIPNPVAPMDGNDASGAVLIGTTGFNSPTTTDYLGTTASFNTADTANLQVEYTPLTMNNVHGKNEFTLTITDTNGPVTDLTDLQVMPMMYMADRIHSTPMGTIEETVPGVSGIYKVTVYYLMPSRMMDGTTMGTWDLKVMINMQSVHFYPNIEMAMMSNTARVQLKGVSDTIIDMNGLEVPRTYNLFRDNLDQPGAGSTYNFDVFIAPIENMMSFPALVDGMTLTSGMGGTLYPVSGITVEASDDGGATWNTGVPTGIDGVWNFSGSEALTLASGANEVRVRLTVSSEDKTTNGLTADPGVNDFAVFTVTLP